MPPMAMIALAAGAAGAWAAAARDAGRFRHGLRTAAAPGEPTLDAWSQRKRYLDVGTRTVAYVKEGSGDPVLLHGCPGVPPEERTPDFMQQRAADVR
jgi:hypothetical protein